MFGHRIIINRMIWDWLVVGNTNFIFPYIGNSNPNWLSHFQRGRYTTMGWYGMFDHLSCDLQKQSVKTQKKYQRFILSLHHKPYYKVAPPSYVCWYTYICIAWIWIAILTRLWDWCFVKKTEIANKLVPWGPTL